MPNKLFHLQHCIHRWHVNKLYHNCTYNRRPEDEPSGSKHSKGIVNIVLTQGRLVGLYYMNMSHNVNPLTPNDL
jgi:hypothetical protein